MTRLNNLSPIKPNDILYLDDEFYIIVLSVYNHYLKYKIIRPLRIIYTIGDITIITKKSFDYMPWYKLNESETQEMKLSLL